jgi:hypothetical protein
MYNSEYYSSNQDLLSLPVSTSSSSDNIADMVENQLFVTPSKACFESSDEVQSTDFGFSSLQPLLPGLYNLVPKHWLRTWRRYIKDPELSSLPALDCTNLFCNSHG